MKRYYVVSLNAGEEDTAIINLKKQGFVSYRPMLHSSKKGVPCIVPMFDGYMFVKFDIDRDRWKRIAGTKGVYELLTATEDRCSPLPIGYVEGLRKRQRKGAIHVEEAAVMVQMFKTLPKQLVSSFSALKELME